MENNSKPKRIVVEFPIEDKEKTGKVSIDLPSDIYSKLLDIANSLDDDVIDSDKAKTWIESLVGAIAHTIQDNGLVAPSQIDNSTWRQHLQTEAEDIRPKVPEIKDTGKKNLKGDAAVILAMTKLGLGTMVQIPLPHSGFWVTIETPSRNDLLNLYLRLGNEKVSLGRTTYGLIYSNMSVYVTKYLVEFIVDHIHSTSLNIPIDARLLEYIKVQDLPILINGLISSLFPEGFDYRRPCANTECQYVAEAKVDPKRLFWIDTSRIDSELKQTLSKRRQKSVSVDEVKRYQETLPAIQPKALTIETKTKQITLTIRSPSISTHIDQGTKWIDETVDSLESILSTTDDPKEKEAYLLKHADMTKLREYQHFIESIVIDSTVIEDQDAIGKVLAILNNDNDISGRITKEIQSYIDQSTIALIGIPDYLCPECQKEQSTHPVHKHIIPIDNLMSFFTLSEQIVT